MAGLSTTLYDSGSIELISAHSAAATSGPDPSGRALSDVAHGPTGGLRYFEIEVVQLVTTEADVFTLGVVGNDASLDAWLGSGADRGWIWRNPGSLIAGVEWGSVVSYHGAADGLVGSRQCIWVDCGTRRIWITGTDRDGGRYGDGRSARPDTGAGPSYTVPGTGPLRVAITPGRGSGADRNVLRFRSRYSELLADRLGALPWDARTITLTGTLDAADVSVGETLRWAWFDAAAPHLIASAPTSVGSTTVLAGHAYSIPASTSLDSAGTGMLVLMKSDGTPVACRGHVAPVTVP